MWITWKKELLHYAFILEGLKDLLKTEDVINQANLIDYQVISTVLAS